jgi:hypothetical protein
MATTTNKKFELSQNQLNELMKALEETEPEVREEIGKSINSLSTFVVSHDCE